MNKNKIEKSHGQDHISCNFEIKEFNKTKRNKEFIIRTREHEKGIRARKYHCPNGYEWNLDTGKCVPVAVSAPIGDNEKPSVPQNLRITDITSTSISLAWDASIDNAGILAYKIFFKKQGSPTYAVTTRGLVANFQGFIPDTTYSFYVKAVNISNNLSNASPKITAKTLTTIPPPSGAVIYVDFNGGIVTGTSWNTSGDIPYASSGLTLIEEDMVIAGITQDFAPFNVSITTSRDVFNAADPFKRTWVIVTQSWEWYCGTVPCAGGVGFIGSMFWGNDTPCWVFSSALSYYSKYVAEACSHEVGHTIGLRHQSVYNDSCAKIAEYNPGDAICGCAPIMGVSYYRPDGMWWVGPSSISCTLIQDDHKFIVSKLGIK